MLLFTNVRKSKNRTRPWKIPSQRPLNDDALGYPGPLFIRTLDPDPSLLLTDTRSTGSPGLLYFFDLLYSALALADQMPLYCGIHGCRASANNVSIEKFTWAPSLVRISGWKAQQHSMASTRFALTPSQGYPAQTPGLPRTVNCGAKWRSRGNCFLSSIVFPTVPLVSVVCLYWEAFGVVDPWRLTGGGPSLELDILDCALGPHACLFLNFFLSLHTPFAFVVAAFAIFICTRLPLQRLIVTSKPLSPQYLAKDIPPRTPVGGC